MKTNEFDVENILGYQFFEIMTIHLIFMLKFALCNTLMIIIMTIMQNKSQEIQVILIIISIINIIIDDDTNDANDSVADNDVHYYFYCCRGYYLC